MNTVEDVLLLGVKLWDGRGKENLYSRQYRTLEPTYVGGGSVFMGMLVEFPRSYGVHLDEGDAATAPLFLWLVDGQEGLEKQIDDALGYRVRIDSQAGQQVVHVAHVPKLGERYTHTKKSLNPTWHLRCGLCVLIQLYQIFKAQYLHNFTLYFFGHISDLNSNTWLESFVILKCLPKNYCWKQHMYSYLEYVLH